MAAEDVWTRRETRQEQYIRDASGRGYLLKAKDMIRDLSMVRSLTTVSVVAVLEGQYQLAKKRRFGKWLTEFRSCLEFLLSPKEIDRYFPIPGRSSQPKPVRTAPTEDRDDRGLVRDVRLLTSSISVVHHDAGEGIRPHYLVDPSERIDTSRQSPGLRSSEELAQPMEQDKPERDLQRTQMGMQRAHQRRESGSSMGVESVSGADQRREHRKEVTGHPTSSEGIRNQRRRGEVTRHHGSSDGDRNQHERVDVTSHSRSRDLNIHRSRREGITRRPRSRDFEGNCSGSRESREQYHPRIKIRRRSRSRDRDRKRLRFQGSRERNSQGTKVTRHRMSNDSLRGKLKRKGESLSHSSSFKGERSSSSDEDTEEDSELSEPLFFYRSDRSREQWESEKPFQLTPTYHQIANLEIEAGRTERRVTLERKRDLPERQPPTKRIKRNKCPFSNSYAEARRLKRHVYSKHVPAIFHNQETPAQLNSSECQARRLKALEVLSEILIRPCEQPTPRNLMTMVNRNLVMDPMSVITPETQTEMRHLCKHVGWEIPHEFTLTPINSPAVLIHWRPMAFIMDHLNQRDTEMMFREYGRAPGSQEFRGSYTQDVTTGTRAETVTSGMLEREASHTRTATEQAFQTQLDTAGDLTDQSGDRREDKEPLVTREDGKQIAIVSMKAFDEQKHSGQSLRLSVNSPDRQTELDYEGTPSPEVERHMTEEEEEALLNSPSSTKTGDTQTHSKAGRNKPNIGVVQPRSSPKQIPARPATSEDSVAAFDSHFHPDRLGARLGTGSSGIEELMRMTEVPSKNAVAISGGVMVYCDPETHEEVHLSAAVKWRIAVGFHPKKVGQFSPETLERVKSLLTHPRVTALGEVGIDYSKGSPPKELQRKVLEEMLKLSQPHKVLILHIRGNSDDPLSSEASRDCLEVVRLACPPEQKLHLHCFAGGLQQVREWRSAFPDCYFGLTGKAARFTEEQKDAMRRIPLDRLLLETDAPYLPMLEGLRTTTPAYIGDVATFVALIRKEPVDLVIGATKANGEHLYQL